MNQTQRHAKLRQILSEYEVNEEIEGEDRKFVFHCLSKYHPEADQKVKPGMRLTKRHNQFGTKSFILLYEDGSTDDFSIKKC